VKPLTGEQPWQNQILNWVTTTAHNSHQAIMLQLILVTAMLAALIHAIGFQILISESPGNSLWRLLILIILYGISRTKFYSVASILLMIMLLFQQFLLLIPGTNSVSPISLIVTPIFALPVVLLIFQGQQRRLGLWASGIVIIASMLFWITQTNYIAVEIGWLLIIITIALMVFVPASEWIRESTSQQNSLPERDFLELSPDMVLIVVKGRITHINQVGLQLLGLADASEVIGQPLTKYMPERNGDTPSSDIFSVRSGDFGNWTVQSYETLHRADGDTLRLLVTATQFDEHNTHAVLLTAKPIPLSNSATDTIVESANAILSVQRDGKILFTSGEFERMTGHSREEVYARDYTRYKYVHDDDKDRVSAWMQQVFAGTNDSDTVEYRLNRKSDNPIWVRSSARGIRYMGKPAMLFTTVDISKYHQSSPMIVDAMPVSYLLVKEQDHNLKIVGGRLMRADSSVTAIDQLIGLSLDQVLQNIPDNLNVQLRKADTASNWYSQRDYWQLAYGDLPIEWTATHLEDHESADYVITLRSIQYEHQLERDVERFQSIFNMMNDYAYMLKILPDDQYEYIWASHAFKSITGYDPQTEPSTDILENLYHPGDQDILSRHFRQLSRGEMAVNEYRIITKSGQTRWMREYAYPVTEDGQATFIYGSVSDLTSNVIAEETLKNYAMQQAVVAEIGMVAVDNQLDVEEFALQALNLVTQLMEVPWCTLLEYHPTENRFSAHSVIGRQWTGEINNQADDTSSYLGYVLDQNDPVVINDWSREKRFAKPPALVAFDIQSSLSVVVPMQDVPFGVLNIHSDTHRQFTADNINVLQMVANIIGAYIQQKRIQAAEHEHHMVAEALSDIAALLNSATELDDILLIILNFVSQIVPVVDSSNIMLVNPDRQTATIAIRHNVNESIPPATSGQEIPLDEIPLFVEMIETGKPKVINDVTENELWHVIPETRWIRSYLAAPIFAGDECLGVVNMDSANPNVFTHEHLEQLEVFMNHASIAIQNARHAEELAREVEIQTQQLQSERAQLQAFFHATGEGIFYSVDKEMLFVNQKFCEMMGYDKDELLGQRSTILRPDDLTEEEIIARERITQDLRTKGLSRAEIRFQRKDGAKFVGAVTASRVSLEGEKILSVTIVRDISQELAIQEQRNSFISHAAHELRNPITSLNTRVYLMKKKEDLSNRDIEKVEQIVQKMNSLVSGLLDFSRYENGRIPLNLKSVIVQNVLGEVHDIQQAEAEKDNLTLTFQMPDTPVTMVADELRLYQIVTNLVSNAIHYTPNGGDIHVSLDYVDATQEQIVIHVRDTGVGIPKDKQAHLFQPFFQVNEEHAAMGTGLGLSITKQLVEAHGGEITVKSNVGEGTCFTVTLPVDGKQD